MYDIVPGATASSVILHVPHASRVVPEGARGRILLDDDALTAELDRMTDAHTDVIAAGVVAAAGVRPWTLVNRTSRLVVDPERFPDEREEMRAVGMGAVYTRTSHGGPLRGDDPAHEEELLATYYRPYAAAMGDLVDDRLAATGRAFVVDVHSYPVVPLPYERHAHGPRPIVCLGTDPFHTPRPLVEAARRAFAACGTVALDTPFAGCYVPLRHFRREPAVTALMVEVRRDAPIAAVARALTTLIVTTPGDPP
jgi:N-formylglutamate deformylase